MLLYTQQYTGYFPHNQLTKKEFKVIKKNKKFLKGKIHFIFDNVAKIKIVSINLSSSFCTRTIFFF